MTESFDHDRVSELLPAFLDGTLTEADTRAIAGHLDTCEDCRSEATALRALRAPVEPLTSSERLALEHKVMAGIAGDAPAPVTELPRRRAVGARVAQALGAAALVAAIGTFFYLGGGMGSGDDESASEGGDTVGVAQEESEALRDQDGRRGKDRVAADAAAPEAGNSEALGSGAGGSADTESSFKAAPEPDFTVEDDPFTAAGLQKLGESSLASVRFANYYSADDAESRNTLLEQLVSSAEAASDASVAAQVDECGAQVLDTEDPTIPTFGALGELDGQPVLVLGFAFTRQSSGTLDRYMVWAWEEGSCSTAVDFVEGRIETAG
jgi:anti-sigma factor RsiW